MLTKKQIDMLLQLLHNVQYQGTKEAITKSMEAVDAIERELITLQESAPE